MRRCAASRRHIWKIERNLAGQGRAGLEQRGVDLAAVADHLRDRDRLAEGAPEPERRGGSHPGHRGWEDDAPHHLPPVAPSASAPSFSSSGTVRNRSRLSEAIIGTTMIVRISPAVNRLRPVVWGGPKIGKKPNAE